MKMNEQGEYEYNSIEEQKMETINRVVKEILLVNPNKRFVCIETIMVNGIPEYNAIFENIDNVET